MPLNLVHRSQWDKIRIRERIRQLTSPASCVFFVNSHTNTCDSLGSCTALVRKLRALHVNTQTLPDIRYNFLVGGDGRVYEGRGWGVAPMLPKRFVAYHRYSLLIGFIGNYTVFDFPEDLAQTTAELITFGVENNLISKTFQYHNLINTKFKMEFF